MQGDDDRATALLEEILEAIRGLSERLDSVPLELAELRRQLERANELLKSIEHSQWGPN